MIHYIAWRTMRSTTTPVTNAASADGYLGYTLDDWQWLTHAPQGEHGRDGMTVGEINHRRSVTVEVKGGAGWPYSCLEPTGSPNVELRFSVRRIFATGFQAADWVADHQRNYPSATIDHTTSYDGDPLPGSHVALLWVMVDDDKTTMSNNARKRYAHRVMLTLESEPDISGKDVVIHYLAQIPRLDRGEILSVARDEVTGAMLFTEDDGAIDFDLV